MNVYSTYSIFLSGKDEDLRQATALLRDTIIDQNCFSAFDSISEDDDSDDEYCTSIASDERFFEVVETSECVWLEDVESLAAELVALVPEITFSISGQIHDSTPKADDRIDVGAQEQEFPAIPLPLPLDHSLDFFICIAAAGVFHPFLSL